jgi:hypothetical protein
MKKIAEALVQCGYADYQIGDGSVRWKDAELDNLCEEVEPFADTLEGRRQADALEDWLFINHNRLWAIDSKRPEAVPPIISSNRFYSQHQWRLDRIKWCFEQLEVSDD